jgi:hypothetical protein
MNSTDWREDGAIPNEAVALAGRLNEAGVDYVAMFSANIAPGIAFPPATPGHQVSFAAAVKNATGMQVMAVGKIIEPGLMRSSYPGMRTLSPSRAPCSTIHVMCIQTPSRRPRRFNWTGRRT